MRPRSIAVSLVVFAVLAVGALVRIDRLSSQTARRDERFLTLGQLAKDLAAEKQTFERVLSKLGPVPGLLGDGQLAVIRKLFELGDYDALDAQPQVTLDTLGSALGVLASRRGPVSFKPLSAAVHEPLGLPTAGEELMLPVPHAQLLIQVRGPKVNADVTLYPALDLVGDGGGGLRFRGDVTADQPWCGGRIAHTYEKEQAMTAIDWMTKMRRAYEAKVRAKSLPLDGYFALGVCTLAPAVVEHVVTGKTTLWPLTHDPALFDLEDDFDRLVRALPHDGRGAPAPDNARLSASLPWPTVAEVPFGRLRAHVTELKLLPEKR